MADAEEEPTIRERVVELLNQAVLMHIDKEKIALLAKVQELVIHRQPDLLDSFFDEIVGTTLNTSAKVKIWLVSFIEEACKKEPQHMMHMLLPQLTRLLQDDAPTVVKRTVQATSALYRSTLITTTAGRLLQPVVCKEHCDDVKTRLTGLLEHENDGVRTMVIKSLESIILMQTYSDSASVIREKETPFCLDNIPLTEIHYRPRKLEEEAKMLVVKMIEFQGSLHISSVNLMTCMSSLVLIARARPCFLAQVFESLELLHSNLPPTLSESQVNSVRKHLKSQLLSLLKHGSSAPHIEPITALLKDLGMSSSDLSKAVPSLSDMRRAAKKKRDRPKLPEDASSGDSARKRPRLQASTSGSSSASRSRTYTRDKKPSGKDLAANELAETMSSLKKIKVELEEKRKDTHMDVSVKQEMLDDHLGGASLMDQTSRWVLERLSVETVSEIVMESMLSLPATIPGVFHAGYTPVAGAGTPAQKSRLARLLAAQMVAAGCSPLAVVKAPEETRPDSDDEEGGSTLISFLGSRTAQFAVAPPALPAPSLAPIRHKIAAVKLSDVTSQLTDPEFHELGLYVSGRFLKSANKTPAGRTLAASLLVLASKDEVCVVEDIICEDIASYSELLQLWLFSLHSAMNDFSHLARVADKASLQEGYTSYKDVLLRFVTAAIRKVSEATDVESRRSIVTTLHDVLLYTPTLPAETISGLPEIISQFSTLSIETMTGFVGSNVKSSSSHIVVALAPILREVAIWRTSADVLSSCVTVLCRLAAHADEIVRGKVTEQLVKLLTKDLEGVRELVLDLAQQHLDFLTLESPPQAVFRAHLGRADEGTSSWDPELVRAILHLPFGVMPHVQVLVHHLANVYVDTVNEAKRGILALMVTPVEEMGMDSHELLRLVSSLPQGTETLITRTIHILTEKRQPSAALVCQVRELYNRRVSDVRFLIPVITGLGYNEVVAVLPKLVKLNQLVVKEVFNKLWTAQPSPLTSQDLLVELHLITPEACEIKVLMKATGMCITDKVHYPPEVLEGVLTELLKRPMLPTLFMRTVIMSLTHHPDMRACVLRVLDELVRREIWLQPKQWEGFIKCSERCLPDCLPVLVALPTEALSGILASAVLKRDLTKHVTEVEGFMVQFPPHLISALGLGVGPSESNVTELSPAIST